MQTQIIYVDFFGNEKKNLIVPTEFFHKCVILQIQTFENLIEPVVESIRFLSDLEFDVLSFCIIEHLAAPDKQQLKVNNLI